MEVGIQELSETGYWLTLLVESGTVAAELLSELRQECNELTSIFVASVRTAKRARVSQKG
jgi:four helix bundle protein